MNENKITAGHNDLGTISQQARSLVNDTAGVAADAFTETRQRVVRGVDKALQTAGRARDRAVDCAKSTDVAIREHPYRAAAIALGIGALLGFLLVPRRKSM